MPRKVEENIEVRNRVRASMLLPVPLLPDLDATEIGDTSDESKAKLRAAGLLRGPRSAAEEEAAARRRVTAEPDRPLTGLQQVTNPGAGTTILALGRFPGPAILRKLFAAITARETAAGGNASHNIDFRIGPAIANSGFSITAEQYATMTPITIPTANGGLGQIEARLVNGSNPFFEIPLEIIVPWQDWNLAARIQVVTATLTTSHVYVTHAAITAQAAVYASLLAFPVGRTSININTSGAVPRTAAAPVPRAAEISVTQGGRVLSSRIVAWESLTPALRADWFNRQVGGAADPNIRWIP